MKYSILILAVALLSNTVLAQNTPFSQAVFDDMCTPGNGVVILPPDTYDVAESIELKGCDFYARGATFNVTFATSSANPAIKLRASETLPGARRFKSTCRKPAGDNQCVFEHAMRYSGKVVLPNIVNSSATENSVAFQIEDVGRYRIEISEISGFDTGVELVANDNVAYLDFFFSDVSPANNMKNNTNFRAVIHKNEGVGEDGQPYTYLGWINQLNFFGGRLETTTNSGNQLEFDNPAFRFVNAFTWNETEFVNGIIKLEGENFAFNKVKFTDQVVLRANNYVCKNNNNCVDKDGQLGSYRSKDNVITTPVGNVLPMCEIESADENGTVVYSSATCTSDYHLRVEKSTLEYIRDNVALN
ncbi:hypothetical protein KIH87_12215 [Paraneptunicella aestuarii]|uniref:hypothetical protein n=1 Tax=Paraneptunicella aestuarii TaxID=2831148 RepID=UPI001E4630EE|nr:hypothetical protein [Paraneptunicella aestuarii]UAA37477.1 hypothetical protein KIH87_12215 [Paraneptunicella aestuarii]